MGVTLEDIAREAQVSPSTVSRVLNNKGRIGQETRERVMETALRMGYSVDQRPAVKQQYSMNVGILFNRRLNSLVSDPFYGVVMMGVQEELRRYDYHVFFAILDGELEKSLPHSYSSGRFDGLILAGCDVPAQLIFRLREAGIPIVLVDNDLPGERVDAVVTDNFNGAYHAVQFLALNGHKKIGFVGGPMSHISLRERHRGYKAAVETLGLEWQKDNEIVFESIADHGVKAGYKGMTALLQRNTGVTAVLADNDQTAIGVIKAVFDSGRKVPHHISVVGFDDIDMSSHTHPPLTTVRIPKDQMGAVAGKRLYELIRGIHTAPVKVTLSTELVVRESVKPFP